MKNNACTITFKISKNLRITKSGIEAALWGICALSVFLIILTAPSESAAGAIKGLKLCSAVIIPSVFPCSVAAIFLTKSKLSDVLSKLCNPLGKAFNQGGKVTAVIMLSLISGYPVGAKLISELNVSRIIDDKTAKRLTCLCVNPGPAFCVLAIGKGVLGSVKAGYLLFFANVLACLLLNIVFKAPRQDTSAFPKNKLRYSDAFVNSVSDACSATLGICAWVVFISCVTSALSCCLPQNINTAVTCLCEVTTGIIAADGNVYVIAFLVGFGGFCVHAQVFSSANARPEYILFLSARVLSGILCALIFGVLMRFFPVARAVAAAPDYAGFNATLPCFIALVVTIIVFIISANKCVEK